MTEKKRIITDEKFWEEFEKGANSVKSQPLKKQKPKKDCNVILTFYHLFLESVVFWSSRTDYRLLVRDFVDKKINGVEFQGLFLELWYADLRKFLQLIEIIEDGEKENEILDFCYTSESLAFRNIMNDIFYVIEEYESSESPEFLRSYLQKEFLPILEGSTINLDKLIDRSYQILYSTALAMIGFVLLVNFNFQ